MSMLFLFHKLKIIHIFDLFKFRNSLLAHQSIFKKTITLHSHITFINITQNLLYNKLFVHHSRTSSFGQQTISNKITVFSFAFDDLVFFLFLFLVFLLERRLFGMCSMGLD
eukprot:Lithocolla_globosa_v1_NODE_8049_length_868_cov_4.303813.p1 type:complete len:111 gc:universal NODE_8049_length_868_cov_4.303813:38-370(+)